MQHLEKDNNQAMINMTEKVYSERGITFSPRINEQSQNMNRNIENLLIWGEVKKYRQIEKQRETEIEAKSSVRSFVNPSSIEILRNRQIL